MTKVVFSSSDTSSCARLISSSVSASCFLPLLCESTPSSNRYPFFPRYFTPSTNSSATIVPCGLSCNRYRNPFTFFHASSPATAFAFSMYFSSASGPAGTGAQGMRARHFSAVSGPKSSPGLGFPVATRANHATSVSGSFHPSSVRSDLRSVSTRMKPFSDLEAAVIASYWGIDCSLARGWSASHQLRVGTSASG